MNRSFRTGRRQFAAQSAAALAAATLPGALQRAVAQEATPTATVAASPSPDSGETRVRFTVGDVEIIVLIADNPTSRDFLSTLPLTLEFQEFAGNEKISYLPRELTTEGSPGTKPLTGDLIYYAPWGNLGFFYSDGGSYSDQVIPIGTVETGLELLNELETGPVHVEVVQGEATPEANM
ncbi:MAG: cyclophilin-like fold protein [Thermomicrobiales bacterium]|nr:cyclophilin-like fold protein [Thermomicrobiales bacterium]